MDKVFVLRSRFLSYVFIPTSLYSVLIAVMVFCTIFLLSLCFGNDILTPLQVVHVLFSHETTDLHFIVESLRLPRVLMAAMVGAALAGSGLILQSMIQNPLASPDIIGLTGGASTAAVCFMSFFSASMSLSWLPVAAIVGALIAALLIYGFAWRKGVSSMRLVLVGIGISAIMTAITTFIIAVGSQATSISAYIWLTGSVYGTDWKEVYLFLPWFLVGWPLALLLSRPIDAQELGDQIATGLGIPVQSLRLLLLLLSVLMAAPAIAYAGAVGFVGLIAPHIARKLTIRRFSSLLPITALIGACLVMLADLCGRMLFQPLDIPAGVFVSAIGAPFFIFLLFRQKLNH